MTRISKKLTLILLAVLCIAACLCFMVACDPNVDKGTDYTVMVKLPDNTPASGVDVAVKKGTATFDTKTTDANGKVTFNLAEDEYTAVLSKLPKHYSVPSDADLALTVEKHDITVTLSENFSYKVHLVKPDGTPFFAEGVQVGICTLDGNCRQPEMLEAGGLARMEAELGDYHVQILELPVGFAYVCDDKGYYTGDNFSAEVTEMNIVIYPVEIIDFSKLTELTAEEKAEVGEDNYLYGADAQKLPAYKFSGTFSADEKKYFAINPAFQSNYGVYANGSGTYSEIGTLFVADGVRSLAYDPKLTVKANTLHYFVATANDKGEYNFVLTAPVASYTSIIGEANAEVSITLTKAGVNAIVAFEPQQAGKYTATVQSSQPALVECTTFEPSVFIDSVDTFKYFAAATCSTKLTNYSLRPLFFSVSVAEATSYPVTFTLKIQKTDIADNTVVMQVEENLSPFAEQDGRLTPVPMDGEATIVYNETDRFYHYGTVDGPVVVVLLTESNVVRYGIDSALAYFDMADARAGSYTFVYSNSDLNQGDTVMDYRIFIRGFGNYDTTTVGMNTVNSIPKNITTEKYYAKFVNSDGVYPLTEELKVFIEKFCEYNANVVFFNVPEDTEFGCEWLFPCYYYDTNVQEEPEDDAILGEYKWVSFDDGERELTVGDRFEDAVLTDDYKLFVINKNGTFTISDYNSIRGYEVAIVGEWSNTKDGYSFTNCLGWGFVPFNAVVTFDSSTGEITLVFTDEVDSLSYTFQKAKKVNPVAGTYKLVSFNEFGDDFAVGDDYYGVTVTDEFYKLTVDDETYKLEKLLDGEYEEVEAGSSKESNGVYSFVFVDPDHNSLVYSVSFNESTGVLTMTTDGFSYVFQKV